VFIYLVTAPENILLMMRVEIAATTTYMHYTANNDRPLIHWHRL